MPRKGNFTKKGNFTAEGTLPKVDDFARPSRAPQPRTALLLMKAIFAKDGHWLPPVPREGNLPRKVTLAQRVTLPRRASLP
jgi:hypothetical protein